jgi:hypothetical protein
MAVLLVIYACGWFLNSDPVCTPGRGGFKFKGDRARTEKESPCALVARPRSLSLPRGRGGSGLNRPIGGRMALVAAESSDLEPFANAAGGVRERALARRKAGAF